jgi:hypothetical protein
LACRTLFSLYSLYTLFSLWTLYTLSTTHISQEFKSCRIICSIICSNIKLGVIRIVYV